MAYVPDLNGYYFRHNPYANVKQFYDPYTNVIQFEFRLQSHQQLYGQQLPGQQLPVLPQQLHGQQLPVLPGLSANCPFCGQQLPVLPGPSANRCYICGREGVASPPVLSSIPQTLSPVTARGKLYILKLIWLAGAQYDDYKFDPSFWNLSKPLARADDQQLYDSSGQLVDRMIFHGFYPFVDDKFPAALVNVSDELNDKFISDLKFVWPCTKNIHGFLQNWNEAYSKTGAHYGMSPCHFFYMLYYMFKRFDIGGLLFSCGVRPSRYRKHWAHLMRRIISREVGASVALHTKKFQDKTHFYGVNICMNMYGEVFDIPPNLDDGQPDLFPYHGEDTDEVIVDSMAWGADPEKLKAKKAQITEIFSEQREFKRSEHQKRRRGLKG